MKKLYTLLLLTFICTNIFAQTLTVNNSQCVQEGGTLTVTVDMANFTNIKAFSFFINYDNTVINNPIIGAQPYLPSGITGLNTTASQVRFVWLAYNEVNGGALSPVEVLAQTTYFAALQVDPNNALLNALLTIPQTSPQTIPNSTSFTITFDVVGSIGDMSPLTISNHGLVTPVNTIVTPTANHSFVDVCTSLPVELTAFDANTLGEKSELIWETASEINNSHFEIERSIDGENWRNIGRVEGNGTTTSEQYYTYYDSNPQDGVNYYRLKQVDFNGGYDYSETKSVSFSIKKMVISVYPNPTSDYLVFNGLTKGSVLIYNVLGQKVGHHIVDYSEQQIDVSSLANGQYFIRILSDDNKVIDSQKIIKK